MHMKSSSQNIERDAAQKAAIEAQQNRQREYWSGVNSGKPKHLPSRDRPLRLLALGMFHTLTVVSKYGRLILKLIPLDGGGVRGLISLLILDRIMKQMPDPNAKPCDYFDLIGGTSTGGEYGLRWR